MIKSLNHLPRGFKLQRLQRTLMIIVQQKHHQVLLECFYGVVMKCFGGRILNHLVRNFHLPICPRMPELRGSMVDAVRYTQRIKWMNGAWLQACKSLVECYYNSVRRHSSNGFNHILGCTKLIKLLGAVLDN